MKLKYLLKNIEILKKKWKKIVIKRNEKNNVKLEQMLTENKTKPKNQKANFYCKECGKSLTNKYDFAIHIRNSHPKENKCKVCEKTFIDSWKFELHIKSHDDVLPLKCNICDKEETYCES